MSKFVKLWTSAQVNGRMRHPHEGVLHLEDDEAKRLIEAAAGEDVTADFSADQRKHTPVERLTTVATPPASTLPAPVDPLRDNARIIAERQAEAAKPKPRAKGE